MTYALIIGVIIMSILQAAFLGLIQGICEFLPISSSGHLVLFQQLMGLQDGTQFFDVMLHVGTLLAIFIVLFKDIALIVKHPTGKTMRLLIMATIPTVVIALVLKKPIDSAFSTGRFLGVSFIFTAILLLIAENYGGGKKRLKETKYTDAVKIGIFQGIALLPGVSRSGSTIAGGLLSGLDRNFAARFSFLLSVPAILGAAILEGKDAVQAGLGNIEWVPITVGVLVATISGIAAIKLMLRIIKKASLKGFSIYLFIIGFLILVDQLFFNMFFASMF